MVDLPSRVMDSQQESLSAHERFEAFKFYEEAAARTKAHAWTQTTWVLTLNAAILAFSVNFYVEHHARPDLLWIEYVSASVGAVLCLFLMYMLSELGSHVQHYWTTSNRLAADSSMLVAFVGESTAAEARKAGYQAAFPRFCRRLQLLSALFLLAHLGWFVFIALLLV